MLDRFNPHGNTYAFFLGKINNKSRLLAALRHNKRTIQAERGADSHIDASRIHLNYALVGDDAPEAIAKLANLLAAEAKHRRKDNVLAVEWIIALPLTARLNQEAFFESCSRWAAEHFGGTLLSFDVHLDEAYPHAHALILPLIDGRMAGSAMVGHGKSFAAHQNAFHIKVASKFGLVRPVRKLKGKAKQLAANAVLEAIKNDPVTESLLYPVVEKGIRDCPDTYANFLGLDVKQRVVERSFVAIMTSKGRGSALG